MNLSNHITNDGSRHFYSTPEKGSFQNLKKKIEKYNGMEVTDYLSDEVTEIWIDFEYKNKKFTVNNQMGEFWYFSSDPECEESILIEVARAVS